MVWTDYELLIRRFKAVTFYKTVRYGFAKQQPS